MKRAVFWSNICGSNSRNMQARKEKEDCYVRLARKSLETFVRTGRKASLTPEEKETLPREMTESRAGVFVSIHKDGMLRGCIGTIAPVAGCVAGGNPEECGELRYGGPSFSPC